MSLNDNFINHITIKQCITFINKCFKFFLSKLFIINVKNCICVYQLKNSHSIMQNINYVIVTDIHKSNEIQYTLDTYVLRQ